MTVIRNLTKNSGIIAGASVATSAAAILLHQSSPTQAERQKTKDKKLEVYLMDRIATKPYLNYHSVPNAIQAKRTYRGRRGEENAAITPQNTRPKGVPSRLRILALDVPQFKKEALEDHGVCQLPSEIFATKGPKFVDGVAPPKAVDKKSTGYYNSKDDKSSRKERRANMKPIVQKSLAKQLYYCYDSRQVSDYEIETHKQQPVIGVEILEGSIMDLNPNNIRRTYTSTSGKMRKSHSVYPPNFADGVADVDEANEVETETEVEEVSETESEDDLNESEETDKMNTLEYERTAPWNQYAWLEEMYLRINGIVPFNEPIHRAHTVSQWLYGRIYAQTIAPTYSAHRLWMWWWWSSLFSYNRNNLIKNGGVDGNGECDLYGDDSNKRGLLSWPPSISRKKLNRASNKPHAVIADGTALHRVPGSLRFLTKTCRDANVPLFILNDPRSWGSQTHSTLSEAVVDMRRSVTDNVVSHCLDIREGSAFERGRLVGQFEKELAWQASDAARKTREAWKSARRRLERDKCEDWSELDDEELRQKLIARKVLTLGNGDDYDQNNSHVQSITSTKQLLQICRKCIEDEEKRPGQ